MIRSPRLALLLAPLVIAACGAPTQPAAVLKTATAPVVAAATTEAPAVARTAALGYQAPAFAVTADAPLPTPTDAYFTWEWQRNVYSFFNEYTAGATLAFSVPQDARITGVNVYLGTEKVAIEKAPGGVATIPAPRGDVKYWVATHDAAGNESTRLGPLTRPKEPKRYGGDPVVTARGTRSLTLTWTTDLPTVGYLRYAKAKTNDWRETPVEARANGVHAATIADLGPFTRYTVVAFQRRNGEDLEVGRANRWTKPFSIFGSEPAESEAAMNAD